MVAGAILRIGFFLFGLYQDEHMPVKYTDIDYLVFSDAASFVYEGDSPYKRETYRYTPLLAWMLVPNAMGGLAVHFGKLLFMFCDLLTGVLITRTLRHVNPGLSNRKLAILSSLWLLNPMVITISTRGSSESVLTFLIMIAVDHFLHNRLGESAFWLGLTIHFKIYPVIYLPAFMLVLSQKAPLFSLFKQIPLVKLLNVDNITYFFVTVASFLFWSGLMFQVYGYGFIYHLYLYHFTRLDHRHNFSLYNMALYYKSAAEFLHPTDFSTSALGQLAGKIEQFAFVPQMLISVVCVPFALARENLLACFFVQTFAFVTYNKVITSQYFIWFLIFLPHFLARTKLATKENAWRGLLLLVIWVFGQASWLFFAYKLEFLGESTFDGGLIYSAVAFFLGNCWMLSQFITLA